MRYYIYIYIYIYTYIYVCGHMLTDADGCCQVAMYASCGPRMWRKWRKTAATSALCPATWPGVLKYAGVC